LPAEQLEKAVMSFIEKKFNVMVTTKIVESGIDIPSVNTIIINRADKFGLAELYQLRGRVGRSNIQASCYMIVPPPAALSRIALKRLQAIQELTELGSGLKLAMRDLEIRGAGNLLGAEQSGFIEDVGFELYQKIVDEAVDELKHDEFRDLFRDQIEAEEREVRLPVNEGVAIEIEGDALIPKEYIRDDAERYDFYLRMYTAPDTPSLNTIFSELRDRFGPVPEETLQLFTAVRLRLAAMPTGATRATFRDGAMRLDLPSDVNQAYYDRWFQPIMHAISSDRYVQLEPKGRALSLVFNKIETLEDAEQALARFTGRMAEAIREGVGAE
jgi:transcription-repair coupling factor (superfamily II helicase)